MMIYTVRDRDIHGSLPTGNLLSRHRSLRAALVARVLWGARIHGSHILDTYEEDGFGARALGRGERWAALDAIVRRALERAWSGDLTGRARTYDLLDRWLTARDARDEAS